MNGYEVDPDGVRGGGGQVQAAVDGARDIDPTGIADAGVYGHAALFRAVSGFSATLDAAVQSLLTQGHALGVGLTQAARDYAGTEAMNDARMRQWDDIDQAYERDYGHLPPNMRPPRSLVDPMFGIREFLRGDGNG
ncbi:hypothetical protein EV193_103494 [Herbihabitans rhizosphaerae]|uniref:Uncharacterized protein n=2 Tax=Herbihabitans rhizosphaerae TaxID=1872711 RepID=A0A4Q7KWM5_9PSEU|nr:hypothetical protein EV193_103494 [Herbihabitans rhizosphaerae]